MMDEAGGIDRRCQGFEQGRWLHQLPGGYNLAAGLEAMDSGLYGYNISKFKLYQPGVNA